LRLFKPGRRHRNEAWTGTTDALISAVGFVGGVLELAVRGAWWGLLLVLAAGVFARDAYLKYKVGNWP
jgi:hypothetical protein